MAQCPDGKSVTGNSNSPPGLRAAGVWVKPPKVSSSKVQPGLENIWQGSVRFDLPLKSYTWLPGLEEDDDESDTNTSSESSKSGCRSMTSELDQLESFVEALLDHEEELQRHGLVTSTKPVLTTNERGDFSSEHDGLPDLHNVSDTKSSMSCEDLPGLHNVSDTESSISDSTAAESEPGIDYCCKGRHHKDMCVDPSEELDNVLPLLDEIVDDVRNLNIEKTCRTWQYIETLHFKYNCAKPKSQRT